METLLLGRRIEDRDLEPTATGHPRSERKDEVEAIRRRRNGSSMGSRKVQCWIEFTSDRKGRHRRGVQSFRGFDCS